MRNLSVACLLIAAASSVSVSAAFAIEAVRGKNYALTKEHGPWMVMVASFHNVPEDRRDKDGLTAEQAALELVYELRAAGIPAYTYSQDAVVQKIQTVDRQGRDDERIYAAQRDMVCVLAGNWKDINDKEGQKALASIKKYYPKFLKREKSGAIIRQTADRKGPLSGAFMTINPLLSPEEVAQKKKTDSESAQLASLNAHSMFSLTSCKKKYSVQVATFTGSQSIQLKPDQFEKRLKDPNSYGLNRASEDAMQLVAEMRKNKIEAYVYHDWYQSIVTVGSFDNPYDPVAVQIARQFGPQIREDPQNPKQQKLLPYTVMVPSGNKPGDVPLIWLLDMQPRIVRTADGRPEMLTAKK